MRNRLSAIFCGFAMLALSSTVMAKGGPTPQNHHCVKDGADLTGKTRKECKKEGGKWEKDKAAAAPAAAAPAPAAAPKTDTKPAAAAETKK
jgi:hypothetical protein